MADGGKSQNRRLLGDEDASMVFETSAGVQVVPTFDSMGLRDDLLRGIYAYGEHSLHLHDWLLPLFTSLRSGFEKPSAIQQRSILPIVRGRDVIAQAQSGTGKTATYSISLLQKVDIQLRETQALVLSPTRELAVQIQKVGNSKSQKNGSLPIPSLGCASSW